MIKTLRVFETQLFEKTELNPDTDVHSLLEYISQKMTEVSAEIKPESRSYLLQRLKKLSMVPGIDHPQCPCCGKFIQSSADKAEYPNQLGKLADDLIQDDDATANKNRSAMKNYQNWRSLGKLSCASNFWQI